VEARMTRAQFEAFIGFLFIAMSIYAALIAL
jgi:hypothetical protein